MSTPRTTDRPHHSSASACPTTDYAGATIAELDSPSRSGHGQSDDVVREKVPVNLPRVGLPAIALCFLAFALLLGGLFVLGYLPTKARHDRAQQVASAVADGHAVVSVVAPKRPSSTTEVVLPANIQAFQQTAIYARANGYLRKSLVDIGDLVQADQPLAELDTPEIDAQLNQSRATAQQSEANLAKAQVDLTLAESTLNRYDDVQQSGAVAQQELDEKRTQVDQAKAGVNVAKANLEAARAQTQQLEVLKGFARITAPFTGVVTARNYDVGALLSPNTASGAKPLFQMEQIDTLRVFVNVPQSQSTAIEPGQDAELRVSNYPGKVFQGKLVRSAGSIDDATRTLRVEIHVPNKDRLLYAGMYGQVRLRLTMSRDAWVVPASALVYNADGLSLAIVQDGGVHFQKITPGRDYGTEIEVLDGLSGGEQVITNPGEHIREGSQVQIVAASQPSDKAKK